MLAKIENDFFSGVNLAEVSLFESDERRAFRLSQVERLLKEKYGNISMAMRLSDLFWTAEGSLQPGKHNALLLLNERSLTDEELERLRLILEIAHLCHDLAFHYMFNLRNAFGIRNNSFWVSNKKLVEWLTTTTYEQIAMHTAYIMKKFAINIYECIHYQPAQDALAELFSMEHRELVREPDNTEIPPRDYVIVILDEMLRIDRHWLRGRRLKLRPDLVMLHDEIYGVVPSHFDKGVLNAAQALYDYMDKEVCGRLVLKDYNYNASSWNDQPESVKRTTKEVLGRFAAKVRDVRAEYLAKGWVADNSLEFSYLMAHAERCGYGRWREEDEAL